MKKFLDLLPQLGMRMEIDRSHGAMVTVWEGEWIVCLGDVQDALRRAEPWFWQEMVDRKLADIL